MPLVTAELVQVQTASNTIVTCPSIKPVGGVMMLMAVVPVTWNSGPEATIVAPEATGALKPYSCPAGEGSCCALIDGTIGPKSAGKPAKTGQDAPWAEAGLPK